MFSLQHHLRAFKCALCPHERSPCTCQSGFIKKTTNASAGEDVGEGTLVYLCHLLAYLLSLCFCAETARRKHCSRNRVPAKPNMAAIWPFVKSVQTPAGEAELLGAKDGSRVALF